MASLAQEEMSFDERGRLVEQIVDAAFDLFSGGLVAKWNRVGRTWYEGTMPRYAVRMSDYFSAEPYNHTTVQFSPALIQYLLTRIILPPGITFDTLIDADIPRDPRTGELVNTEEYTKVSILTVVQRRFRDRLDGLEFSRQGDDPRRYKQPVQAPVPVVAAVVDYYGETGFESVDQIKKELKKIYPPLLEPVKRLTEKDKQEIREFRNALTERNNGAYEAGKIVLKDRQINDEQEEIDWINAHGGMSEEEYVLALEKKDDKSDEDVAFLNKYCNENGYNDWEDAFETLKIEDYDDEDMSGAAVLARAEERIAELNQEKAELQRQAALTEEVTILMNDYATRVRRTYIGAYAIDTAHRLNNMISGKLKKGARRANDERIPRLQAKLRFAMEFYEGIDQIFKDNDTVPLVHEWRAKNYRSNVVRYVVWGMANPQHGVDRLLFKPQATMVQRLIRTSNSPSLRTIQYMIFDDRLTDAPITEDILEVTLEQGNAYKDKALNITPKKQRPATVAGTVERPIKRKDEGLPVNPKDQKAGGTSRKPNLKIQTTLDGFKPIKERGRSRSRVSRGEAKRLPRPVSRQRTIPSPPSSKKSPSQSPPLEAFGFKQAKPFTPRGSPPPVQGGDGKIKARSRSRSRTPVGRDGGTKMDTSQMLNKLSLKF